jgi:peptidoglycan/xylan/chitin deacetylase (PgdA/CDA1 family)
MATFLPILTFHTLDDQSAVISFPPRVFRRGMARLHENGYRTINFLETVDFMRLRKPFPERSFVITFDDGYESVYDQAFPILQDYGMTATIFLTVGERRRLKPGERLPSLEGRPMLSWKEIEEMKQCGITFGAHTLTHPDLTDLPQEQIEKEICDSKAVIENAVNTPVSCFAYPYGRYNDRVREITRKYFACACSDTLGLITAESDLYALKRVDAYYLRTDRLFDVMLTRWFPRYIWARSVPRRLRRAAEDFLR